MKLIKPSYKIITKIDGEEILKEMELAARTCYKSEGKIEYEEVPSQIGEEDITDSIVIAKSARVLIPKLIERGHDAMLEFGGAITVKFICDRGVSHELVRHRIASFAQESTRYCNYGKGDHIQFIIPCWLNIEEGEYPAKIFVSAEQSIDTENCWFHQMRSSENSYNFLIKSGWSPQHARSVLPNSLKTEINVSANIREWRHIFRQRTSKAAHPQMRELMIPLLKEFQQKIPILFDDIKVKE